MLFSFLFPSLSLLLPDDSPDGGVHAGRVPAAGEDPDTLALVLTLLVSVLTHSERHNGQRVIQVIGELGLGHDRVPHDQSHDVLLRVKLAKYIGVCHGLGCFRQTLTDFHKPQRV